MNHATGETTSTTRLAVGSVCAPASCAGRRTTGGSPENWTGLAHTRTAPYPSQTDINFAANWPGVEWIIVGLAGGDGPEVRSYLIDGGEVREVTLQEAAA